MSIEELLQEGSEANLEMVATLFRSGQVPENRMAQLLRDHPNLRDWLSRAIAAS